MELLIRGFTFLIVILDGAFVCLLPAPTGTTTERPTLKIESHLISSTRTARDDPAAPTPERGYTSSTLGDPNQWTGPESKLVYCKNNTVNFDKLYGEVREDVTEAPVEDEEKEKETKKKRGIAPVGKCF